MEVVVKCNLTGDWVSGVALWITVRSVLFRANIHNCWRPQTCRNSVQENITRYLLQHGEYGAGYWAGLSVVTVEMILAYSASHSGPETIWGGGGRGEGRAANCQQKVPLILAKCPIAKVYSVISSLAIGKARPSLYLPQRPHCRLHSRNGSQCNLLMNGTFS